MEINEEAEIAIDKQLKSWINSTQNSPINRSVEGFVLESGKSLDMLADGRVAAFIYDFTRGNYYYFNSFFPEILGFDRDYVEKVGIKVMQESVHPDDFLKCLDITQQAIAQFENMKEEERYSTQFRFFFRIRQPKGLYQWVMQSNRHVHWDPALPPLDLAYIVELFDQSHPMKVMGILKTNRRTIELFPRSQASILDTLSSRELEILRLIALGLSSKQVSEKLVIASNTVKTHRRNILTKLNVKNMMQAKALIDGIA
jgi:DNA-binding CsgD family transcriptional regulator